MKRKSSKKLKSAKLYNHVLSAGLIIAVWAVVGIAQTSTATGSQKFDVAGVRQRKSAAEAPRDETKSELIFERRRDNKERRVFVRSTSLLVRAAVVEDKLLKRPDFYQLGFVITRDEGDADLILELRHDLFTKYVFSIIETRTQLVLAGGKLSSLGGTVAGKVAKRFVKEMSRVAGP
jgi:hypothetical protein